MTGIGDVDREVFEAHFEIKGQTVFAHKNFGTPNMESFESRAWKDFSEHNKRQVVFKFAEQEEIYTGMVLQIKGARDFWKVTDTEDLIEDDIFVCMEALVEKINEQGSRTRINTEGKAVFNGNVYGGVQVGGQNNTQTNTVNLNTGQKIVDI